jgi:uncharacterized membrane protein YfcA
LTEILLIVVVLSFSFWVKAVAGFGGPLVAIPLLAPFIGVEQAVVVLALPNTVANLILLWTNRHVAKSHRRLLTRLLLAGAAGTIGGTVLLTRLDDAVLAVVLAVSVFGYIAMTLLRPEFVMSPERGLALAIPVGAGGGLMHGALGASGTVFGSFYHSLKLPRDEFVFALTITFLWFGSLQIGTLAQLGSFGRERIVQSLIAVIPVFVVTPLGERLSRSLNAEVFGRVVLALLATSAIALIVGALA